MNDRNDNNDSGSSRCMNCGGRGTVGGRASLPNGSPSTPTPCYACNPRR